MIVSQTQGPLTTLHGVRDLSFLSTGPLNGRRPFQVAAGENPTADRCCEKLSTDISQGCEMTPEVGLKNEAPARAYSVHSGGKS